MSEPTPYSDAWWDREATSALTRGATSGDINGWVAAALRRAYRDGKARGEERGYRKGLMAALDSARESMYGAASRIEEMIRDLGAPDAAAVKARKEAREP